MANNSIHTYDMKPISHKKLSSNFKISVTCCNQATDLEQLKHSTGPVSEYKIVMSCANYQTWQPHDYR